MNIPELIAWMEQTARGIPDDSPLAGPVRRLMLDAARHYEEYLEWGRWNILERCDERRKIAETALAMNQTDSLWKPAAAQR